MVIENKDYIIMLAKVEWYEELFQVEPHSKLFLPYARLLFEFGSAENSPEYFEQAIKILRNGLEYHQDFIEARLFLIEVLHHYGQSEKCGIEVAKLASLFLSYPDFWDAWREHTILENDSKDFSVALGFMGALVRDKSLTLRDIFNAGLANINPSIKIEDNLENSFVKQSYESQNSDFCDPSLDDSCNISASNKISELLNLDQINNEKPEIVMQGKSDSLFLEQQILEASELEHGELENADDFSMPDHLENDNLIDQDVTFDEPADKQTFEQDDEESQVIFASEDVEMTENQNHDFPDIMDEDFSELAITSQDENSKHDDSNLEEFNLDGAGISSELEVNIEGDALDLTEYQEQSSSSPQKMLKNLLSDSNIVVEEMNSSPFRTRSMAEVLVEQGNTRDAINIYQELIAKAQEQNSQDEVSKLSERLKELEMKINNIDIKDNFEQNENDNSEIIIQNSEPSPNISTEFDGNFSFEAENSENIEEKSTVKSTQKAVDLLNKLASRLEAKAS